LSRTDVNSRKPGLRVAQCCEAKKAPIMTLRNRRSADSGLQCAIYELRPRFRPVGRARASRIVLHMFIHSPQCPKTCSLSPTR
jgi:hypothetical protein